MWTHYGTRTCPDYRGVHISGVSTRQGSTEQNICKNFKGGSVAYPHSKGFQHTVIFNIINSSWLCTINTRWTSQNQNRARENDIKAELRVSSLVGGIASQRL